MKSKVKAYFDILSFIRDNGPKKASEIIKSVRISESTFYGDIKNLIKWGWAKKIGRKYAYYDYKDINWEVEKWIRAWIENPNNTYRYKNKYIPEKIILRISKDVGKRYDDKELKDALYKVAEKLGLTVFPPWDGKIRRLV